MKRLRLKNNVLTTKQEKPDDDGDYLIPELSIRIHSSLVEPIPDDEVELVPGREYVVDEIGHGLHGQTVTFRSYQKPRVNLVGGYSCEASSLKPLPKLSPVEEVLTRYGFVKGPVEMWTVQSENPKNGFAYSNRSGFTSFAISGSTVPPLLYDTPEKLEAVLKLMGLKPVEAK